MLLGVGTVTNVVVALLDRCRRRSRALPCCEACRRSGLLRDGSACIWPASLIALSLPARYTVRSRDLRNRGRR